jgi:hypothetical protein
MSNPTQFSEICVLCVSKCPCCNKYSVSSACQIAFFVFHRFIFELNELKICLSEIFFLLVRKYRELVKLGGSDFSHQRD